MFPTSLRARSESSFKSTHRRQGRRDARRLHGPAGLSEHTAPPRCYILNVSVSSYQQLTFWGVELWQLFSTSREPAGTMRPEWGLRGKHEIMSFNPTPGTYKLHYDNTKMKRYPESGLRAKRLMFTAPRIQQYCETRRLAQRKLMSRHIVG